MDIIIVYDFEVFKYDWLVCWIDTEKRKMYKIVNDKVKFEKFYEYYKDTMWVGYNSRNYDQWIAKAILCDFDPFKMNDWIINKKKKGWQFSNLLHKFPIVNYDTSVVFKGLKELEAFQGHSIRESNVPWDIDRKLTRQELQEVIEYCEHDVWETFNVFLETKDEYESHLGLVKEFDLDRSAMSKTKAQISAMILGANKKPHNDEFDIRLPDTLQMGQYQWIADWYLDWGKNVQDYKKMKLETKINGVPHTFGIGGLHGSQDKYFGEGYYIMADVASYYPAMIIEYDFMSRNVHDKSKYKKIRDERIIMKAKKDPRQYPRKIVLNSTFGAMKDPYNHLYDPLQANNICIAGQLLLTDLLDKLDGKCELIQSNTDGILIKLFKPEDRDEIIEICEEWSKRTRMDLEYDDIRKVIQRDVNNYIIVDANGKVKRKGGVVKELNPLDNNLPIVNEAIVKYFLTNTPVRDTIMSCNELIKFQFVKKVSSKYDFAFKEHDGGLDSHTWKEPVYRTKNKQKYIHHWETYTIYGTKLHEKVHRVFATTKKSQGGIYKKHKDKIKVDKMASTPDHCFTINDDITELSIPPHLDREWYVAMAEDRISKFI